MGSDFINFFENIDFVNLFKAIILITVGFFIAKILSSSIKRIPKNIIYSSHKILINKVIFFIVLLLFVSSALQQIGFDITALLGAAGILTLIITIAAQSSLGDIISGLILLANKSLKIGDLIKINEIEGEIVNIGLFTTQIKTFDGLYIQIPNETMSKSQILNYSYFGTRRVQLIIKVYYAQDLNKVEHILLSIAHRNTKVLREPVMFVQTNRLLDHAFEIYLFCWTKIEDFGNVTHELHKEIQKEFLQNNIEFVFTPLKMID